MRAVLALGLLGSGCGFSVAAGGNGDSDGGLDAPPEACVSFSSQLDTCGKTGLDTTLSGTLTLNTDTGELLQGTTPLSITSAVVSTTTNHLEVRAWYVRSLTLSANTQLRAVGTRPLAIVAYGKVSFLMGALIDVGAGGAGASVSCTPGATKGQDDSRGGAGGGGGGFGGAGAPGGNGNDDQGPSTGGMAGPKLAAIPSGVLGGCPGGAGGAGGDPGGEGGKGGGALDLASAVEIELFAMAGLNAGGGGGAGGTKLGSQYGDAGGGGGGSGGMIFLEAPRVRSAGTLAANGGGGGEGSGDGDAGNPGEAGRLAMMKAEGGKGGSPTGSDGGKGAADTSLDGSGAANPQDGGAGGGGGGVGFIRVRSPDQVLGTAVTPPAQP